MFPVDPNTDQFAELSARPAASMQESRKVRREKASDVEEEQIEMACTDCASLVNTRAKALRQSFFYVYRSHGRLIIVCAEASC